MNAQQPVRLYDLILCLSKAFDLVSPLVAEHHRQVAHLAVSIAREMKLPAGRVRDLAIAGSLHDAGGLSLSMRINAMRFDSPGAQEHADLGYLLLMTFPPFADAAKMVRFHHVDWGYGTGAVFRDEQVPPESHILHLADRVAVLLRRGEAVLTQAEKITNRIIRLSGKMFPPELVSVFRELAARECFWLDTVTSTSETGLARFLGEEEIGLDEELMGLSRLFCRVIDFRSPFTATHTSAVASCAVALAEMAGFSESDRRRMMIAGYIHDLGKLAVPAEILEKPASLTKEEFNIVRTHTYYTDYILKSLQGFEIIRKWGALHHERLDGSGYPYHLGGDDLELGSRILSVADVFVALTEDRPYRKGLVKGEVLATIRRMVRGSALDGSIVGLLADGFETITALRITAQNEANSEYRHFVRQAKVLKNLAVSG